ncbi:Chloroperoxidase [Desarmillaria tabescens]|uniref:Chloroperoxidase n=1 Tax=Armillaria tabescens TaxID=1929756 RepID=A0AA39NPN1_ARMTA|nr:Chloroperoxidase [Desarmillaria tabescens]KAK0469339.1 Chloroperoxidase [Desarmillaria tabescens]
MVLQGIVNAAQNFYILTWDVGLSIFNLLTPNLKPGHVIPEGHPGAGGSWPEYIAPKEGDSRCSCPALNALANHGILPHDGKGIPLQELTRVVRATYNFSPSFCYFVPLFCARMLGKDYNQDVVDLSELDLHNGIEHDASLTRQDLYHEPNQATPHLPYIEELLASPSGKAADGSALLTADDLARFSAKRRTEAASSNPEFSLDFGHKLFGSSNSSTMLTIMGGRVKDLESFLVEERIPDGWESRILSRKGLTFQAFNKTVFKVEWKTKKLTDKAKKEQ